MPFPYLSPFITCSSWKIKGLTLTGVSPLAFGPNVVRMFEADAHRLVRRTDVRADFGTLRAGFKPILISI